MNIHYGQQGPGYRSREATGRQIMHDATENAGTRNGAQSKRQGLAGVGVVNVQMDGVPFQESMWGLGINERCYDNDRN